VQHFYALFIRPARRLHYLIPLLAPKSVAAPRAPAGRAN
jgi:hypothetical protein